MEESITADGSAILAVETTILANLWMVPAAEIAQAQAARQITSGPNRADGYLGLSWMSDERILYGYYDRGETRLATISPDDIKYSELRFPPGLYVSPSTCGDSQTIVFGAEVSGTRGIWRASLNANELSNIVPDATAFAPTCSPDAQIAVYTTVSPNGPRLWKISTHGGQPTQLSDEPLLFSAISPDGGSIASLHNARPHGPQQLAILRFDGGPILTTFELPPDFYLVGEAGAPFKWAPDGDAVVYISTKNGVSNLWAQPVHPTNVPTNRGPRRLSNFKSDLIFSFAWSRSGEQLALARGRIATDAVLISHFR